MTAKRTITRVPIVARLLKGGLKTALPLMALFVGVSSYLALTANKPAPPKHMKRETVQPVRTQEIVLASHQPGLILYGEIKTGRKVELRALVAGKVLKTGPRYREGALVKKGDLLLSIDPFKYKGALVEAKARIKEAKARIKEVNAQIKSETDSIKYALEQFKLSKRDLERAQKLVNRGSVTRQGADARAIIVSQRRQTLEGKRSNLNILRAKHEQQLASLDSLKWHLQQAERNQRDTNLRAPFEGYIGTINANVGKLLNVNDQVGLLLDSQWMDVAFTLSDRQYGRLLGEGRSTKMEKGLIGRDVKVTWKLGSTSLVYEAVIERVGAQISSESGGVSVYAKLKSPSAPRPIRAGAFVDVLVSDRIYQNVVRLPQTSLYGRSKVYVVGPKNRLQERLVKLRAIDGEHVLVSGDLANGDHVVTTRMSTIGTGMKVHDVQDSSSEQKKPASPRPGDGTAKNNGSKKAGEAKNSRRENRWQPTRGGASKKDPDQTGPQKRQRGGHQMNKNERSKRG